MHPIWVRARLCQVWQRVSDSCVALRSLRADWRASALQVMTEA